MHTQNTGNSLGIPSSRRPDSRTGTRSPSLGGDAISAGRNRAGFSSSLRKSLEGHAYRCPSTDVCGSALRPTVGAGRRGGDEYARVFPWRGSPVETGAAGGPFVRPPSPGPEACRTVGPRSTRSLPCSSCRAQSPEFCSLSRGSRGWRSPRRRPGRGIRCTWSP